MKQREREKKNEITRERKERKNERRDGARQRKGTKKGDTKRDSQLIFFHVSPKLKQPSLFINGRLMFHE